MVLLFFYYLQYKLRLKITSIIRNTFETHKAKTRTHWQPSASFFFVSIARFSSVANPGIREVEDASSEIYSMTDHE